LRGASNPHNHKNKNTIQSSNVSKSRFPNVGTIMNEYYAKCGANKAKRRKGGIGGRHEYPRRPTGCLVCPYGLGVPPTALTLISLTVVLSYPDNLDGEIKSAEEDGQEKEKGHPAKTQSP